MTSSFAVIFEATTFLTFLFLDEILTLFLQMKIENFLL